MAADENEQAGNAEQLAYWNSESGRKWARYQEGLDTMSKEVKTRLLEKAAPRTNASVLDVGCGTGDTAMAASAAVGKDGRVLGVDLSTPLLDMAKQRAAARGIENIDYLLADAQSHRFSPESADLVISRFGMMFFSDPVQAFANIGKAMKGRSRIVFVCWAALEQNPWFSVPRQAAVERLGEPSPTDPMAPGPLAFKDIDRVKDILLAAGFSDLVAETEDVPLPFFRSLSQTALLASNVGAAARIARELNATEDDLAAITASVEKSFQSYADSPNPSVPSRLNFFSAMKA